MFSQISSRDLFFSNPVERFLGNDAGFKTSLESGFSSTLGYSQNDHNKELLSGNSEEIFSQTPKAIKEPQATKTDYQKYISQNLLFGKKGKTNKYGIGNKENGLKDKISSPSETRVQELQGINEIKDKIESLFDGIRRLNADVSDVKDSVKGIEIETTRQNERISCFEEAFAQQTNVMKETQKHWKKCNKEDTTGKLHNLIIENFKETKQAIEKLKDTAERNLGKTTENIRKSCTSQSVANKKISEEIKKGNDLILRKLTAKMDKLQKDFEEQIETLKKNSDENCVKKIEELKTHITNSHASIKEIITSHKPNPLNSSFYKTPTIPSHQKLPQSVFHSGRSNISTASNRPQVLPGTHQNLQQGIFRSGNSIISQASNRPPVPNHQNLPRSIFPKETSSISRSSFRPLAPSRNHVVKQENSAFDSAHSRSFTNSSVHTPLAKVMERNNAFHTHTPLMVAMKRNKTPSNADWMERAGNKVSRISDFNQTERRMATSVRNYLHESIKDSPSTVQSEPSLQIINEIRCPSSALKKSAQTYSRRQTSFNFKKYATPPKPRQPKNLRRSKECFSEFDKSFTNEISVKIKSRRNEKHGRNLRPKKGIVNYKDTDTNQSSPYLSVFEATRAREFTFA